MNKILEILLQIAKVFWGSDLLQKQITVEGVRELHTIHPLEAANIEKKFRLEAGLCFGVKNFSFKSGKKLKLKPITTKFWFCQNFFRATSPASI